MRVSVVIACCAALLLCGAPAAFGAGAEVPPDVLPHDVSASSRFGAFAGEVWVARAPTSISASWRVPRITAGSRPGFAATWVGIQGRPTPNEDNGPFIQVGINEEGFHLPVGTADDDYAFFSDTALGFSPRELFPVRPGDEIDASLRRKDHRWIVYIRDARSHRVAFFATTQEAAGSFNQAEWLQEDVTNERTQKPFPYPSLSTVHFTRLRVNGLAPRPTALLSQWMSENGANLGPDPVSGDGFSLADQTISALAAQYLRIAAPFADVDQWFGEQSVTWTPATPSVETSAERSSFSAAAQQEIAALQAASWPADLQSAIAEIVATRENLVAYLQTAPPPTISGIAQWLDGLSAVGRGDSGVVALSRRIDVPAVLLASD